MLELKNLVWVNIQLPSLTKAKRLKDTTTLADLRRLPSTHAGLSDCRAAIQRARQLKAQGPQLGDDDGI